VARHGGTYACGVRGLLWQEVQQQVTAQQPRKSAKSKSLTNTAVAAGHAPPAYASAAASTSTSASTPASASTSALTSPPLSSHTAAAPTRPPASTSSSTAGARSAAAGASSAPKATNAAGLSHALATTMHRLAQDPPPVAAAAAAAAAADAEVGAAAAKRAELIEAMVEMGVEAALAEEALQATHWNTDSAQEWLIMRHTAAQLRTSRPPGKCAR
jgi:hypothetical protein